MRNIADIVKDDRNGKQLSKTERQIAVAYVQGKYDAVRELKISNNLNTNEVLEQIRAKIEQRPYGIANDSVIQGMKYERAAILAILDKCKAESEKT